ncbi:MAG: (Fe-S)-binding protein [Desulfobacula sp.]|jgi:heterodisulfide reductase subunit D|uniref:(Fe-S)-binding protein n=1 Tax=Desulfobacula sp. TaxID=2593537 RepID=UPI001E1722C3|nr:(Fe-S)-binding protein [Desulfobacula sp.]MBT3484166.1 (Fe-S)-binding protein [Desulfobacula sp.]MBT4024426.1 (Fe-S)-binding protein [Desulfobacula sp.]MBT4198467.1 (Fe-S)-binding protein [Desulfobacula sp.]MBT4505306.1 (Fe-S)-binding protein [Desulfobacula sp.]
MTEEEKKSPDSKIDEILDKKEATPSLDSEEDTKEAIRPIPIHKLDMKRLIELDSCTRCGECLTWCPVYDQDSKEKLIPRRKIIDFLRLAKSQNGLIAGIMQSDRVGESLKKIISKISGYRKITQEQLDDFVFSLYECSTCGQCEVVCPAHIDTVGLWEELRRLIVRAGYGPLEPQKALRKSVMTFDNPWQQPRAGRTKWSRRAKKDRLIADEPRQIKKTKGKVLLFFGCTASYDANVKRVAINTINILEALNIDYGVLGKDEKCCGSVLLRMGDPEYKRLFSENIEQFNSLGIDTLISSCSGCFKTIMQDYPKIKKLNFEVLHTVEYLTRLLKSGELKFPHPVNKTVTFHDPCHLGRATGGFDAPRMIMEAIPGLNLVEMSRNREYSRCCGAGGGLKAGFPEIQGRMSQRRIKEAEETGAKDLVSCCPFCYQGLQVGINASGSDIVMRDLSEFIAESILGYDVFERAAKEAEEKKRLKEEAKAIKLLEKEKKAAEKKKAAEEKKKAAEEKKKAEEEKKAEQEKIEKKKPEAEDKIKEDKEVELPGEPDKAQ